MSKTIQLTRSELVWQTRQIIWDAEEFQKYLNWLKTFEGKEDAWCRNNYAIYELLAAYTWDEVVDMIQRADYDDEPKVNVVGYDGEVWYTQCLSDVIREAMREDVYNSDIVDEDYADDYNEEFEIQESDN